jgi:hypothetical protein
VAEKLDRLFSVTVITGSTKGLGVLQAG